MKLISKCLIISLFGLSAATFADDSFTLVNHSNQDLTAKLNGVCSTDTVLGPTGGVTVKGETRNLPVFYAKAICAGQPTSCRAELFASRNCSGETLVATAALDVGENIFVPAKGVVPGTVSILNSNYHLVANGFYLELTGG